jgi:DNA-binding NtrC family response regulator
LAIKLPTLPPTFAPASSIETAAPSSSSSFTGASARRRGRFESADRSTLLIDEIGDVVPSVQVKLLRVLGRSAEREITRLGGEEPIRANVRVIAATNRDLLDEIRAGRFREDLYYRLSALVVRLPALRERPGDVPLLARHFLSRRAGSAGPPRIDPAAERILAEHPWPGNIRQLESVLVRSLLLFGSPGAITADDVRRALAVEEGGAGRVPAAGERLTPPAAGDPELPGWFWRAVHGPWKERRIGKGALRDLVDRTLAETGGYYTRAAERLGVERSEYRRFVDFLANADAKVDHRRYRG